MKITTMFLSAAFLAASVCSATAATFGTSGLATGGPLTNTASILSTFRASTNVTLTVNATAASYGAASYHLNGNREFGTASGSTLLFYQDKTAGEVPAIAFTATDSSAFTGSWKSL